MGRLLTTFKDKTFEPSMKSYYQLYTDDTSTAAQIYDSLLYVRGINAGSLVKNQEGDDDVSTVELYDTYMPVRFHNVKSKTDGTTAAGPTHTFFNVYNRAEYNGPSGQNMYDLWADYNLSKLSGDGYITNTIGGAYNYGYDAGSGDDQTIAGIYGALNYARIQPTGDNRTVTYAQGARNWIQMNKTNATATFVYPTTSEFNLTDGDVGTLAMHKFDLDYTAGNITNAYFIWADESSLPTPSGEKYFIKSNISWPTLLSGALTNTGAVTFNSTLSVSGTATLSSNVNIGGNLVVTGTSTFNGGTITIGDAASDNVVFGADVDSHIIPDDDNTYDLGSASQEWRDLYIDGTAYVDTLSLSNNLDLADNVAVRWGDSQDLTIVHDGTLSSITNITGDLYIQNSDDDKDIIFRSDDGSGGVAEYFRLDGQYTLNKFSKNARFIDSVKATFGDSDDLQMFHSSGTNIIDSTVGDLIVKVSQDDGDIIFQSDNGSGGIDTYFRLDGGDARTEFEKEARWNDSVEARFGTSGDLRVYHDGTTSHITNSTGNLNILNSSDDADILFRCDDGSGGNATYFFLDGSKADGTGNLYTNFPDKSHLTFGDKPNGDLQIYHDGSNSYIVDNGTGNLLIKASNNMFFESSAGASKIIARTGGAVDLYYNGSKKIETTNTGIDVTGGVEVSGTSRFSASTRFTANATFDDNSKAMFGDDSDLQIYHDGNNSYIQDNGTGDLLVYFDNEFKVIKNGSSEVCIEATTDASVDLYYDNSKKLETTSTGTKTTGQMDLAALNSAPSSASDTGTVGEIRFTSDYIYVCVASNTWKRATLSTW